MTAAIYEWSGDSFLPLPHFRKECDKHFVVGEVYKLDIVEDRSSNTHRHFFACINEAWKHLPEEIAPRYPTADRLRRRALIKSGFADERTFVFDTPADAVKLSGIVQTYDEDAVVLVKGRTVHVFTAKSQSMKAMGKEEFQRSKTAVLDEVSKLIGIDATTLQANTPGPREYQPEDQT